MLEDEDVSALIMSLANARGEEGFTEEEANILVQWATDVVFNYTLFTLVVDGHVIANVEKDKSVVFKITESGMVEVEKHLEDIPPQSPLLQ